MEMAFACLGPGAEPLSAQAKKESAPAIVLDEFNAEYTLQRRAFQADLVSLSRWVGAAYSLLQWWKLRRYEAIICRQAHAVLAVSSEDKQALLALHPALPIVVVPNGVDMEVYQPAQRIEGGEHASSAVGPTLLFTGTMDFRPNVDAVQWFCREVLPKIWRRAPGARLLIVGRDPTPEVQALAQEGVVVTGQVEDDRPYFGQASVYVVPMRFGGGVRLKVLQAMASGVPVVSTPMGVQGISAVPGRHFLLATSPEEFAARVVELLEDPLLRARLAQEARLLVEQLYDWRVQAPKLEEVYERLRQRLERR
jgi:glycosyltransferase involved in cell wall biosynthesis